MEETLMHQMQLPFTPDYQLKIPRSLQILLVIGAICALSAIILFWIGQALPAVILLLFALITGVIGGLLYLVTDPRGRERARQQMIAAVGWRGSEQVLDVGCGNGTILLSAAQHLTAGQGKATGIDIWVEGSGEQSMQR